MTLLIEACTIIASNYIAQARVLGSSLDATNPGSRLRVLVVDDPDRSSGSLPGKSPPNIEFVYPEDLDLDRETFLEMAASYGPLELCTAAKPWLLRFLLDNGVTSALYLDPDIKVFGPLGDLADRAAEHELVLTPHVLEIFPDDDKRPSENDILAAGIYNLGFIGVGTKSYEFIEWWSARLLRDCIVDPVNSNFVDQRWIDMAPVLFDTYICTDPAVNVAYWNLHERALELAAGGFCVDGRPLKFFHFSGYDPDSPHLLTKHHTHQSRILMSEHQVAEAICDQYARDLKDCGSDLAKLQNYGFERTPSGIKIDHAMRRIYRAALKHSDSTGAEKPPNPFSDQSWRFVDWLNESAGNGARDEISRYLRGLWEMRSDLQRSYPDLSGPDAAMYVAWARLTSMKDESIDPALVPGSSELQSEPFAAWPVFAEPGQLRRGVNLVGYLDAELGVGEIARLALRALEAGTIDCATMTQELSTHRREAPFSNRKGQFGEFDTNLVCVNADLFPEFAHSVGPNFFDSRYTIGLWWWELEKLPPIFRQSFELVDEIWCGSDHVLEAISRASDKPVYKIILPLGILGESAACRARLRGESPFTFLFSFDFFSGVNRKNPASLIDAYTAAFSPQEDTRLIIKTINGNAHLPEFESLKRHARDRDDIEFIDGYLYSDENLSLIESADCYVSLHRAEGLGLPIAEAMARGTPVIATGYSGNLEFTTAETALLVPYTLTDIPPGSGPYPAGLKWAEPDTDAAARLMREVFEDPDGAQARAETARRHLAMNFSLERSALSFRTRLEAIRRLREDPKLVLEPPETRQLTSDGTARASSYLSRGPDVTGKSRFGAPGRLMRRAIIRSLASYSLYQKEVDRGLIDALFELEDGLDKAKLRSDSQLDEITALQVELNDLRYDLTSKISDLNLAIARLNATHAPVRPLVDPQKFIATDPNGNNYIGYDVAGGLGTTRPEQLTSRLDELLRGNDSIALARHAHFVELLTPHAPVLDAGCGSGALLALLDEHHVGAMGVDIDPSMIRKTAARGVKCELGDIVTFLDNAEGEMFGSIFSSGLVEYLNSSDLLDFFSLSYSRISNGGVFVMTTLNPHSPGVMNGFWTDPARKTPLYPEVAVALCHVTGFDEARVDFLPSTSKLEYDQLSQPEYVLIAMKRPKGSP